jgi:predicted nucleic acid-binding protein
MIYLDTSCLVKLIRMEEQSPNVSRAIARESYVIVSTLGELEATIDLKAGHMAGDYSLARWRRMEADLNDLRNREPFYFKPIPAGIWDVAFRQHRNSRNIHCRTLDRLHLSAAEKMGISRLMTFDGGQAKAATELGFEVINPTA